MVWGLFVVVAELIASKRDRTLVVVYFYHPLACAGAVWGVVLVFVGSVLGEQIG